MCSFCTTVSMQLVAQAAAEPMWLLTAAGKLLAYGGTVELI